MRWLRTIIIFEQGQFLSSPDWMLVHESYVRSIASIDNSRGSGKLTIRRRSQIDGATRRNGVGYLRARFLEHMRDVEKWLPEDQVNLGRERSQPPMRLYPSLEDYREPITSDFGGCDFVTKTKDGNRVAIEWETGNISSSHRSMNKLAIALANGIIQAGVLIVPSRKLYEQLTDRVGNIGELSGYLSMWESLKTAVRQGVFAITVVEHDEITDSADFPFLSTGNDGRAAQARIKRR